MSILYSLIEQMTGVIMDGYVNVAGKADHKEAREKVKEFLIKNYNRLLNWAQDNPGIRPPVYFNSDTGEVLWLTRKQNRKWQRIKAKAVQRARG